MAQSFDEQRLSGLLAEKLFYLVKKTLHKGSVPFGVQAVELPQELLLPGGELGGHFHGHPANLIADAGAAEMGNAPAFELESLARLGTRGDLELLSALERGDLDFRPECRLAEADGDVENHVLALALEQGMLVDRKEDIEVAGGAAGGTQLSLARQPDGISGLHARRNLYRKRPLVLHALPSLAGLAGVGDDPALASAAGACAGHAEKSLLEMDLAGSAAVRAGGDAVPGTGAGPVAIGTPLPAGHADLGRGAEDRFREADPEVPYVKAQRMKIPRIKNLRPVDGEVAAVWGFTFRVNPKPETRNPKLFTATVRFGRRAA